MTSRRTIQFAITLTALAVALVRVYFPDLRIDGVTATLLFLAAIPWFAPLFRSIELPGGLKLEFRELLEAQQKVEASGLVDTESVLLGDTSDRHVYSFEAVAADDANLALAGLRIEIESRLRQMAVEVSASNRPKSLRGMIDALKASEILNSQEVGALNDLLPLLNQAAHGAETDPRAAEWALDFGSRLLDSLEDRASESKADDLVDAWNSRDGFGVVESGTALSKFLVSAPRSFFLAMQRAPDSFESWIENLEHHTFTIFESSSDVDDDLYMAFYEKLREKMLQQAKRHANGEFQEEARRLKEALENVNIRRIW